jgi:P-type Ca2+ transporter type 2C
MGSIILVGLAFSIGFPLPLLPVQLLWLNLVTNGIQDVALAFEPSEGDVLRHRPRSPKEPFFNRLMLERTFIAACVMGIVSFSTFEFLLDSGMTEASARNALLLLMVLFGNVHIANCRSEEKSAFQLPPWRSPILLIGAFSALVIHVMMLHLPLGHALLDTEPVNISLWKLLLPLGLTVLVAIELHKLLRYLIRRS